jgi:ABC-type amino acid transport substrate-binding protein
MSKLIGIIAVVAIVVVALMAGSSTMKQTKSQSLADKVIEKGELRVGYIVYPPLLSKDQSTGKLSGVSYEIVEEAAKKLNVKTNWVEEVGWGTALEGLKTGRYDILGTQMWPNSARAREAVFSIAPMYSNIYPYVKSGDTRFSGDLSILNSDQYIISAADGEMSSIIAKDDYPKAKTNTLPQLSSFSEVYLNIVNGKADITFAEPSTANNFLKSNPGKIDKVGNTPIRTFGNSFAFKRGEDSMVNMWNVAIGELINNGTVTRTLQKYYVSGDYSLSK